VRAALALLTPGLAPGLVQAAEDQLLGPAKVRGPDTQVIDGARVRLSGVMPAEDKAACAGAEGTVVACVAAAEAALAAVAAGGDLTCVKERRLGHG
jgi:hypothetical protein